MTENQKPTPKAQAEALLTSLLKGKEVHELFAERMKKQLPISGKSIDYWEDKFKIHIPTDNMSPTLCKELSMKLVNLHQEATFHYAVATAKTQMLKRGSESAFLGKFAAITEEYKAKGKALPAAETLKTLSSIPNEEVDSAASIADMETKFWKSILEHLHVCRKLIETASMNIAVELKATRNDEAIDRMITHNNGGFHGNS